MLSLPFPLSLEKEKHLKSVTLFSSLPHCVGEPGASQGWKLVIVQEYRDKCERVFPLYSTGVQTDRDLPSELKAAKMLRACRCFLCIIALICSDVESL